jgi:nicotinamidase-related amidase
MDSDRTGRAPTALLLVDVINDESVIVTGIAGNICVRFSANDA